MAGGRLLAQQSRLYRGTVWTYDHLSRMESSRFGALNCADHSEIGNTCSIIEGWKDSLWAYNYDALGNRIRTRNFRWPTHAGDSVLQWTDTATFGVMNRMLTGNGCSYTYDGRGSVVRRLCGADSTNFTWNGDRQLTSMRLPDGTVIGFGYDPLGRVVRRSVNGTVASNFLWDGDNLRAELSNTGALLGEYSYYSVDQLHAFIPWTQGSATHYAHQDQRGNLRGFSNGAGTYTSFHDYEDFGRSVTMYPGGLPYGRAQWKGALNLAPEAGLYYMRNRWYEPRTGRFISEDPIGVAAGSNMYAFADGDPVNRADPSGLYSCHITGYDSRGHPTGISCTYTQADCELAKRGAGASDCGGWVFGEYCREIGGVASGLTCMVSYPWRGSDGGNSGPRIGGGMTVSGTVARPTVGQRLKACVASQYGLEDMSFGEALADLGRAVILLGATPIPKSVLGVPVLPGTSLVTNPISASRFLIGDVSLSSRALGTKSLAGMLGRANVALAAGLFAYDATSIGLCTFSSDPAYGP